METAVRREDEKRKVRGKEKYGRCFKTLSG